MFNGGKPPKQPIEGPQGLAGTPFGEICYVVQGETEQRGSSVPLVGPPTEGPFLFPSYFRTIYNNVIYLSPQAGAGVANCVRPGPGGPVYYRAPIGPFSLQIPGATAGATHYLLCGLSGTESIAFQAGDVITFYPSKPAYAPTFPIFGPTAAAPSPGQPLLDDTFTTSWAVITPGPQNSAQQTVYYSQPQQAPLFRPCATAASGGSGPHILDLFQAPAAVFGPTAASGPTGLSFPLFPYAGVPSSGSPTGLPAFRTDDLPIFERQILSPTRRRQIAGATAGPGGPIGWRGSLGAPAGVTATTPQGFLSTVQGLQWQKVILAKSSPPGLVQLPPLQFKALTPDLQTALQTDQLFLVATNPAPLGDFDNVLAIEGWPFLCNVGSGNGSGDFSNVLIFKFRPGRLVDLVATPSAWTQAETFNASADLGPLAAWLQAYFAQAQSWVNPYPDFQNFVGIINNPAWTGVLALKTAINLDQFPAQLKGLLGGMKLSRFNAHHVGIEVNYVHVRDGILELPQSSLFALINYVDPAYAHAHNLPTGTQASPGGATGSGPPGGGGGATGSGTTGTVAPSGPYGFDVEILQVLFANSKIKDFFSKIKLTASTWFDQQATVETGITVGAGATAAPLLAYAIELDGHYEDHHGHPSYTFVTAKGQHYTFTLKSPILNYVEVAKAQFVTTHSAVTTGPTGISTDSIETAFDFWGYLNFKPLRGFDIFSFGSPTGAVKGGEGLYFSNLAIGMDFDVVSGTGPAAPPPKVGNRVFQFQPRQMAFDPSLSTLRPGSLLAGFPMAIQGLVPALHGATGSTGAPPQPSELGYRAITLPATFEAQQLGPQWYALQFHLQMGSMGALAAKAGFVGDVLAAWSPTDHARAMVAIKLPGGSNSGFSLENVLKLKIQDIAFSQPGGTAAPYMLQFKHLGLSLVGVTFPPTGNTDLFLFGPTGTSAQHPSSLGWYGAYVGPTATGPTS